MSVAIRPSTWRTHTLLLCALLTMSLCADAAGQLLGESWKRNGLAEARFVISGTQGRNNPLRRKLAKPFTGAQLFVRFRMRYAADSIDTPETGNGEFFVLWLDRAEGGDAATHSGNVPNIGIHVSGKQNRFMVRYAARSEAYGLPLVGDRDYLVVARLWKSNAERDSPFDHLDLWVDPAQNQREAPAASVISTKSVSVVNWLGFATGGKTEVTDRIDIWDVAAETSWERILNLPVTSARPRSRPKTVDFRTHVVPILRARCFDCHSGEDAEEAVRLDVLDEVLNRTTPRNAAASRLLTLVTNRKMPPTGEPVPPQEIDVLRAWIDEGLEWDESLLPTPVPRTDHWAFQPLEPVELPTRIDADWVRTPIDAFVSAAHRRAGVTPAAAADEPTLARRLSLDVLGLPPGENATTDPAVLLADPAYGERYARHWLDLARWAESNGYQHNRNRPHAWRYRDWVVDAFNSGKPFSEFLTQQIAGDLRPEASADDIIATGFLAATRYSGNELDKDIQRNDMLVDVVNATGSAFLGLTFECAQCHTHKFDPISIRDYYRFQAFFTHGQPGNVLLAEGDSSTRKLVDRRWEIFDLVHSRVHAVKRRQGVPEPIIIIPKSVLAAMSQSEKREFTSIENQLQSLAQSWSFYSPVSDEPRHTAVPHEMRFPLPADRATVAALRTHLLVRGDVKSPGPEVKPGWPLVFGKSPDGLTRTELAKWMLDPDNPLTARVWVNRLWQWHFGRGLVPTSGDFGRQGQTPTHPELLDYLAFELIRSGWDTRQIQTMILKSATYRQSTRFSETNARIDPENKLLWRWTPRRLESEAIRDSILAVSGRLERSAGGPGEAGSSNRRSIYLRQRRSDLPEQQTLFDASLSVVSCSRRRNSISPLQTLWLLNSDEMTQAARGLATRAGTVETAVRLAIGRDPRDDELRELSRLEAEFGLESACLAILNLHEFLYIP